MQLPYLLMTKYLSKLVVEKFLSLIKNMYRRTMTNIILNGGKLESFLLRSETRSECSLPLQLFNILLNEFGSLPSSAIFWKSLSKIGVSSSLNLLKVLANAIKKKEIKDI